MYSLVRCSTLRRNKKGDANWVGNWYHFVFSFYSNIIPECSSTRSILSELNSLDCQLWIAIPFVNLRVVHDIGVIHTNLYTPSSRCRVITVASSIWELITFFVRLAHQSTGLYKFQFSLDSRFFLLLLLHWLNSCWQPLTFIHYELHSSVSSLFPSLVCRSLIRPNELVYNMSSCPIAPSSHRNNLNLTISLQFLNRLQLYTDLVIRIVN